MTFLILSKEILKRIAISMSLSSRVGFVLMEAMLMTFYRLLSVSALSVSVHHACNTELERQYDNYNMTWQNSDTCPPE